MLSDGGNAGQASTKYTYEVRIALSPDGKTFTGEALIVPESANVASVRAAVIRDARERAATAAEGEGDNDGDAEDRNTDAGERRPSSMNLFGIKPASFMNRSSKSPGTLSPTNATVADSAKDKEKSATKEDEPQGGMKRVASWSGLLTKPLWRLGSREDINEARSPPTVADADAHFEDRNGVSVRFTLGPKLSVQSAELIIGTEVDRASTAPPAPLGSPTLLQRFRSQRQASEKAGNGSPQRESGKDSLQRQVSNAPPKPERMGSSESINSDGSTVEKRRSRFRTVARSIAAMQLNARARRWRVVPADLATVDTGVYAVSPRAGELSDLLGESGDEAPAVRRSFSRSLSRQATNLFRTESESTEYRQGSPARPGPGSLARQASSMFNRASPPSPPRPLLRMSREGVALRVRFSGPVMHIGEAFTPHDVERALWRGGLWAVDVANPDGGKRTVYGASSAAVGGRLGHLARLVPVMRVPSATDADGLTDLEGSEASMASLRLWVKHPTTHVLHAVAEHTDVLFEDNTPTTLVERVANGFRQRRATCTTKFLVKRKNRAAVRWANAGFFLVPRDSHTEDAASENSSIPVRLIAPTGVVSTKDVLNASRASDVIEELVTNHTRGAASKVHGVRMLHLPNVAHALRAVTPEGIVVVSSLEEGDVVRAAARSALLWRNAASLVRHASAWVLDSLAAYYAGRRVAGVDSATMSTLTAALDAGCRRDKALDAALVADNVTVVRGVAVLHMLARLVGASLLDGAVFQGDTPLTAAQLARRVETQRDVLIAPTGARPGPASYPFTVQTAIHRARFVHAWTTQPSLPVLSVDAHPNDDGSVTLVLSQFPFSTHAAGYVWPVPVTVLVEKSTNERKAHFEDYVRDGGDANAYPLRMGDKGRIKASHNVLYCGVLTQASVSVRVPSNKRIRPLNLKRTDGLYRVHYTARAARSGIFRFTGGADETMGDSAVHEIADDAIALALAMRIPMTDSLTVVLALAGASAGSAGRRAVWSFVRTALQSLTLAARGDISGTRHAMRKAIIDMLKAAESVTDAKKLSSSADFKRAWDEWESKPWGSARPRLLRPTFTEEESHSEDEHSHDSIAFVSGWFGKRAHSLSAIVPHSDFERVPTTVSRSKSVRSAVEKHAIVRLNRDSDSDSSDEEAINAVTERLKALEIHRGRMEEAERAFFNRHASLTMGSPISAKSNDEGVLFEAADREESDTGMKVFGEVTPFDDPLDMEPGAVCEYLGLCGDQEAVSDEAAFHQLVFAMRLEEGDEAAVRVAQRLYRAHVAGTIALTPYADACVSDQQNGTKNTLLDSVMRSAAVYGGEAEWLETEALRSGWRQPGDTMGERVTRRVSSVAMDTARAIARDPLCVPRTVYTTAKDIVAYMRQFFWARLVVGFWTIAKMWSTRVPYLHDVWSAWNGMLASAFEKKGLTFQCGVEFDPTYSILPWVMFAIFRYALLVWTGLQSTRAMKTQEALERASLDGLALVRRRTDWTAGRDAAFYADGMVSYDRTERKRVEQIPFISSYQAGARLTDDKAASLVELDDDYIEPDFSAPVAEVDRTDMDFADGVTF